MSKSPSATKLPASGGQRAGGQISAAPAKGPKPVLTKTNSANLRPNSAAAAKIVIGTPPVSSPQDVAEAGAQVEALVSTPSASSSAPVASQAPIIAGVVAAGVKAVITGAQESAIADLPSSLSRIDAHAADTAAAATAAASLLQQGGSGGSLPLNQQVVSSSQAPFQTAAQASELLSVLSVPPLKGPKPVGLGLQLPLPTVGGGEKESAGGTVRPSSAASSIDAAVAANQAQLKAAAGAAAMLPGTPSSGQAQAQALAALQSTPATGAVGGALGAASSAVAATPKASSIGLFSWMSASKGGPVVAPVDDKIKEGAPDVENNQDRAPASGPASGPGSDSTTALAKKASPSLTVYIREIFTFVCAAVSVAAAISSYQQLRFAATDVQSIIAGWQVTPIRSVLLVPYSSACPANFSTLSTLQWPGSSSLGCGCPAGAQYQGVSYSSMASSSCSSLHLLAGCLENAPSGLAAVALDSFRGSRVCYQRGLASYMEAAEPSAAGACPDGFHKCGSSNGTYSSDRSQCVPDALGQDCPTTWLGTDFFLSQALRTQGSSTRTLPSLPKLKYKSGTTLHMQRQNMGAVKLQTPLIDLVMNIQQSADQRGPCYGGPNQASYLGPGVGLPAHPAPCTTIDSRWVPLDLYAEADLLQENFVASGQAAARCPSFSSLTASAVAIDFFTSGIRCNNTAAAPDARCESGLSSAAVTCASGDTVCQGTFYQSKCGHLVHAARAASSNIGIYMRPQTYWKEACPYSPSQVRDTEDPIAASINAQYALLIINCIVNAVQALVSIYIIAEKLCRIEGKAGQVKDSVVARVAKVGQVIKLPVIIASIVCVSAIYSFYALLSSGKCSDEITNASFESLGKSLPGVLYGNIATLVCDVSQLLLVPLLVMAYRKHKKPDQVQCTLPQWARDFPASFTSFRPCGGSPVATAPVPESESESASASASAPADGTEGAKAGSEIELPAAKF